MLRVLFLLFFSGLFTGVFAQDLSGTWVGSEDNNFIKLVVIRAGNEYVGFTYDDDESGGFCKANFKGVFWGAEQKLKGKGTGMIQLRGGHVLCYYDLDFKATGTREVLRGSAYLLGPNGQYSTEYPSTIVLQRMTKRVDTTGYMKRQLELIPPVASAPKISPRTEPVLGQKRPGPAPVARPAPAKPPVVSRPKKPAAARPATPEHEPQKSIPQTRRDTVAVTAPKPAPIPAAPRQTVTTNPNLVQLRQARASSVLQELTTSEAVITIKVFDNGVFDGDTISILHNNEVLVDHKVVPVQSFTVTVRLDEGPAIHDITLIAHNVGTIAPNTASLIIEAGDQRYRLTASTDLERNAVIRIHYSGVKK